MSILSARTARYILSDLAMADQRLAKISDPFSLACVESAQMWIDMARQALLRAVVADVEVETIKEVV